MLFVSSYKPAGTKTGRLASAKLLDEFGGNGQNVADEERQLFIPRPGHRFAQLDYEGAEAVAVALYVDEGNFRDLVRRKVKIHNFVCPKIFPDKFTEFFPAGAVDCLTPKIFHELPCYPAVVKHCKSLKTEYDLAKRTVHGSNYSMGWKTFQETILKETDGAVVLPAAECKRLLNSYFDLFPEVKLWQARVDNAVKEFEPITNLQGWSVRTVQRYTASLGRTGISWGPQSTVGIATVTAGIKFQDSIEANGRKWNLLNITHDSLLIEAPADEIEEAARVAAECMYVKFTSPVDGWECEIGVEVAIGDNWGKWSEENVKGLKVCKV